MLARLTESLSLAAAALEAAQQEHRLAADSLARLAGELTAAESAYDADPSEKAGRAVITARNDRDLAQLRAARATSRRDGAALVEAAAREAVAVEQKRIGDAAAAEESRLDHARRLDAARAALPALRARVQTVTEASRKASAAAEHSALPVGLRRALEAPVLAAGRLDVAHQNEADALGQLQTAEDALAALDPVYAAELAAHRESERTAAAELAHATAARRLTVPGFAAEHAARVAPLFILAREVLGLAVASVRALADEHRALAAKHGIAPVVPVQSLSAVLVEAAHFDASDPALASDLGWLKSLGSTSREDFAQWALTFLGLVQPRHYGKASVLLPDGGATFAEQLAALLAGRESELPATVERNKGEDELMRLVRSAQILRGPVARGQAAMREFAYSRRTGRWYGGDAEAREQALSHLVMDAATAVRSVAELAQKAAMMKGAPESIPAAVHVAGELVNLPQAASIDAAIAALLGAPLDLVTRPNPPRVGTPAPTVAA